VHTASTAVGNTLDDTAVPPPVIPAPFSTMSGVAPCASLRTYKVCATNNCSGAAIQAAIEGAIADQVDVINFSISGGSDPWNDTDRVFLDAVGADVFVAASAGNTSASVTDPVGAVNHLGAWVTTVAASTHDLNVSGTGLLNTTGPGSPPGNTQNIGLTPGSGLDPGTAATGLPMNHYAANEIGCTAGGGFPAGYFTGKVALISRGDCTFEEKINNAQAAGAVLAVIYNNAAGTINMSVGAASLPAYSIQQSQGQALVAFIDSLGPITPQGSDVIFANGFDPSSGGADAIIDFTPAVQQGDVIAGFSLRGPSSLVSVTKPDITGPGVNIYAALDTASNSYGYLSGTSMSSPHTAGSGALIRAVHPDWTPAEVKSALMLTASPTGFEEDRTTPWTPDDVGSGRIDLSKAAEAGFVMNETFANFLAAEPPSGDPKTLNIPSARNMNCVDSCTFDRTLRNTLTTPSSWTVTVVNPAGLDVSVDTTAFSFTGSLSQTQDITITAEPTTTLSSPAFAEIVFHEASGAAPDAHIFVAIQGSGSGGGDIFDSGVINVAVPQTFDGLYINWATGDTCTAACGGVFNFNAYALNDGTDSMHFFWPNNGTGNEGGVGDGVSTYDVLGSGDTIGPSSTFTVAGGAADTSNWQAGVTDGYLGFKFECPAGVCFGYAKLTTTAPVGFPSTLVEYWYDTTGAAITIP
jgi:subtilisin family serine protease